MRNVSKLRGRAWVFRDLMAADWEICPRDVIKQLRSRGVAVTEEEMGKFCMTNVDPAFPEKVNKGDFIVAGQNFGCGHNFYHACVSVKGAGIAAVICESSNTNFARNAINHALPVIVCRGVKEKVKEGDELEIDLVAGTIANLNTGDLLHFVLFASFLIEMIEGGGLYAQLKKQIQERKL